MLDEIYTGPDRGHFRTIRLLDNSGVQQLANCRIKEATVFNYLSDLKYAIIGYTVEWWKNGEQAPHEGGESQIYIPHGRPNVNKLYFRAKSSITSNMLYLEDAIINDFLNTKALADPMSLLSYSQEAAEQTASVAIWRELERTPYSYNEAVHITQLQATPDSPLMVVSQGLRANWRHTGAEELLQLRVTDYAFTKLRECYEKLHAAIVAEDE